jgi:hypothetical protein
VAGSTTVPLFPVIDSTENAEEQKNPFYAAWGVIRC